MDAPSLLQLARPTYPTYLPSFLPACTQLSSLGISCSPHLHGSALVSLISPLVRTKHQNVISRNTTLSHVLFCSVSPSSASTTILPFYSRPAGCLLPLVLPRAPCIPRAGMALSWRTTSNVVQMILPVCVDRVTWRTQHAQVSKWTCTRKKKLGFNKHDAMLLHVVLPSAIFT